MKRHLIDFAVLATLITRGDQLAGQMSRRDRELLKNAIGAIRMDGTIIPMIEGADLGIERLLVALSA
ncbi:hypothetical protein [Cryobacterium sp. M91]|uniref:hypothetical protein n=1 Tax=Cryobacterium sp. M91 TaxID=2048294 RepID=UPI000CE54D9C|nr:hypothetical protein [Cryobacterium sp. M91]